MKKLSTLIALILCVTIGGVYAAWTYATNAASSGSDSMRATITSSDSTTSKGTITVEIGNSTDAAFVLTIDESTTEAFHTALTTDLAATQVIVKFTANAGSNDDVQANGIPMVITMTDDSVDNYFQGSGDDSKTAIFAIKSTLPKCENGVREVSAGGVITFTYTFTLDQFISFNSHYLIDYDMYQAYASQISNLMLTLHVAEGTAA